jgi:hypothetical protein
VGGAFPGHAWVGLVGVVVPSCCKAACFHVLLLCRDNFPALPPVTRQNLALSSCDYRDYAAGGAVGLLCFGSMCAKPDDLFSVGALAQGAQGASHVFRGLGWAN